MAYFKDAHFLRVVENFEKDTILADPDSPAFMQFPAKPLYSRWARDGTERENRLVQLLDDRFGEETKLPCGARINQDSINHNLAARFRPSRTLS